MRLCVVNLLLPDFLEVNDNRIQATEQMKQVEKLIFSTVQQKKNSITVLVLPALNSKK